MKKKHRMDICTYTSAKLKGHGMKRIPTMQESFCPRFNAYIIYNPLEVIITRFVF